MVVNLKMLQIDAKISPFYTKWSLLEYIHSKWGLGANDDLLSADINAELQQLRGIYVRTTHKTINDVFRIRSVSIVGANQITFDVYGARTNVADYFRTRYNRDLNFPHFPCVIKGPDDKQEFFPLEVLMIEKGQKFPKTKMNSKQVFIILVSFSNTCFF
uniref:PAZ domain-containing protein n=1 Tax=Panagrolaimus superbus TaxID=310955 RepID=A0A914YHQ3_9BILA